MTATPGSPDTASGHCSLVSSRAPGCGTLAGARHRPAGTPRRLRPAAARPRARPGQAALNWVAFGGRPPTVRSLRTFQPGRFEGGCVASGNSTNRSPTSNSTTGIVTTAAGLIAAVGALIGGLAAAGVFSHNASPPPPPVSSGSTSSRTNSNSTSSSTPNLASIDLVYSGDTLGCVLQLTVQIDGQSALPTESRFTIHNVQTGAQQYTVRGRISCAAAGTGTCTATGSGVLDIENGRTYFVTWANTSPGACDVVLT